MAPSRRLLDLEERDVHQRILRLGQDADKAIENALQCYRDHDTELADKIIAGDKAINALQRDTEERCIVAIARQQPVAGDLRDIISCMYIATELERIADHAADIARVVVEMDSAPQARFAEAIAALGGKCRAMLASVMSAYDKCDAQMAREVANEDNEVDDAHQRILRDILGCMRQSPQEIAGCTHNIWIVHHIERIGDRITNIAERVVFMATGETVDLNV
jgi:phosphate transport system protein